VWCGDCYTAPLEPKFHRSLPQDEAGFHWTTNKDAQRHMSARDGDNLVTPFQCDLCVFRNLMGRNPGARDNLLMACIRQANLDALWGREAATVSSTLRAARETVKLLNVVEVPPPFPALGPHPVQDTSGVSIAIAMLLKSLQPGRYESYQQYETIRKLRAGFTNIFHSSLLGTGSLRSMGGDKVKMSFSNECLTRSVWFERFARGCLSRMGQIVRQDRALSLEVLHQLLENLEQEWASSDAATRGQVASLGAFCLIAFCGSFRGPEMFLVDLFGLHKYGREDLKTSGGKTYVIVPLLGRFKNELGDQYHLTPMVAESSSELKIRVWIRRLLDASAAEGRTRGPAFVAPRKEHPYVWYEREILERLHGIQQNWPDLIPEDVQVLEEYGLSRSFRRGATSEARARGIDRDDIDLTNRWRTFEGAKGKRPRMAMRDHYSDIRLLIPALIRFSEGL